MPYPKGPAPQMPVRFAGKPVITSDCKPGCDLCRNACPTQALNVEAGRLSLDTGRCLFCRECENVCPQHAIRFTSEYGLSSSTRQELTITSRPAIAARVRHDIAAKLFRRSLKLRQVSAGGCNACEADANVLGTPAWDMGRFGIQFVASPRHADGLLITGPVTENMRLALEKNLCRRSRTQNRHCRRGLRDFRRPLHRSCRTTQRRNIGAYRRSLSSPAAHRTP